jgi:hypothetical protein
MTGSSYFLYVHFITYQTQDHMHGNIKHYCSLLQDFMRRFGGYLARIYI